MHAETPQFYLDKAQKAEDRAAGATTESERGAWHILAREYRRLAQDLREHQKFLSAINPSDKAAE
jgi:hypothetical protein